MKVIQEGRPYNRVIQSIGNRTKLAQLGYTWGVSSNVSAVAKFGNDLYIRFLNGSLYKYPTKGDLFENVLAASSKGKWVWRFLRRPKVTYEKVGTLPLENDLDVTDEQLFEDVAGIKVANANILTQKEMDTINSISVGLINTKINTDIILKGITSVENFKTIDGLLMQQVNTI